MVEVGGLSGSASGFGVGHFRGAPFNAGGVRPHGLQPRWGRRRPGPRCMCGDGIPPGSRNSVLEKMREMKERMKVKALREQCIRQHARRGSDYSDNNSTEPENVGGNRIVNGYHPHSRPWFALLGVEISKTKLVGCGGALINHRFIL